MKFQCDRCKTRYSIADERVRGKVLKIRCKNCAGVITVRESGASSEGGATAPAAAAAPARARAAAPLGAAFDRAMAQPAGDDGEESTSLAPPPTTDDEWYLSTGSDQDGPFDVKEARRRIATAKSKDELFGWKEGFADWLPVTQIAELSPPVAKKPPAPPPLPPPRASAPPIPAAAAPAQSGRVAALSPSARPAVPAPAAQASASTATAAAKKPAIGLAALAAEAAGPAPLASARSVPSPAPTSEGTNPSLSLSELAKNTVSHGGGPSSNGNGNGAKAPAIPASLAPPAAGGADEDDADGGLDFKISEASQLIDMSKLREVLDKPTTALGAAGAAARRTTAMAAVGRGTGPTAAIGGDAAPAPVAAPARRPRAALLLGGGLVILVAVVGGLIYLTTDGSGASGEEARRGSNENVLGDYYREGGPNVITRTTGPVVPSGPVGKVPTRPATGPRPTTGVTNNGGGDGGKIDTLAGGQDLVELSPQDVLDKMAQARPAVKQCFNYALKTDPTLRISRLDVRLSVAPDGNVNEVKYLSGSEKSQTLNQCLMTLLKRWHFKPSREGLTTDLPILFSSG